MEHDTRESLLDAAEALFSEHGIEAASLRQITQQAGANLAAVNYHFGSKDGLVQAVFARRLRPLNEERLLLLGECNLEADDAIEQVLSSFLLPILRMRRERPEGIRDFGRLMGRAYSEPSEKVREMVTEEVRPSIDHYLEAFRIILPNLDEAERIWRFHFVAGAMAHTIACNHMLERLSGGLCQSTNPEEALGQLVTFLAAGLRAPSRTSSN